MDTPSIIYLAKNGDVDQLKELLLGGVDLDLRDEVCGQTAISWASERGHLEVVKMLLEKDAGIDIADEEGLLPLYWACTNNHDEIARLLLYSTTKPEDILHHDGHGRSALSYAAMCGAADVIQRLLSTPNIDVDSRDEDGWTPLMFAVARGHEEASTLLLDAKADVSLKDEEGRTALYHAASKGHFETIKILLKTNPDLILSNGPKSDDPQMMVAAAFAVAASGIDDTWKALTNKSQYLTAQDSEGLTALHHAANLGLLHVAKRLVEDGSKVNALDEAGRSPLILASMAGSLPTVKFLLDQEADLNLRDDTYKQTPLMFAVEYGRDDVVQYLCARNDVDVNAVATGWREYTALIFAAVGGHLEIMKNLLKHEPDLEKVDSVFGQSALSRATENGNVDVAQLLIQAGASLYSSNHDGQSPALLAAMRSTEMLKLCIEEPRRPDIADTEPTPRARVVETGLRYGCEFNREDIIDFIFGSDEYLNAQDEHQRNVLSLASEHGIKTEMEKLCEKDLDFNMRDKAGRTPLSWAAADGGKESVRLLLERSAIPDRADNNRRTPLSWASGSGQVEAVALLLDKGAHHDSKDKSDRSPLSWAAAGGHDKVLTVLLEKGSSVNSQDTSKRTPLLWAVANGSEECVGLLLKNGADPDRADSSRRTPLSWAAGEGYLSVVKHLLAYRVDKEMPVSTETRADSKAIPQSGFGKEPRPAQEAGIRPTGKTTKDKVKPIEVNSLDNKLWTPLFHAAYNGHKNVVDTLLSHGADPTITFMGDGGNATIVEHLIHMKQSLERDAAIGSASPVDGLKPEPAALDAVLQILMSSESLRKEPLKEAAMVDNQFSATVVKIPEREESDMVFAMLSVDTILRQGLPKHLSGDDSCRWLHLPANNMTWVEVLMARHFEASGEEEKWKRNIVLKPKLWSGQQHTSWDKSYHARFMRPACHSFALSQSRAKADPSRSKPHSKGIVLFMPFLHWDVEDEIEKLKKILKKKYSLRKAPEAMKAREAEDMVKKTNLNGTEKLYWISTTTRCQTPTSETKTRQRFDTPESKKFQGTDFKPVLTMVDQLWMWVLPEIGRSPPTIITAFPQRCNRMTSSTSKNMTVLIANIMERARELAVRTSGELAEVIASECSRIYLDATSDRKPPIQFLEIYNTSIGEITDKETKRFRDFQDAIKPIKPKEVNGVEIPQEIDPDTLKKMIDIEEDIEDLRQIKDIREELSIMSSLFHVQKEVLEVMDHAIRDDIDPVHRHPHLFPEFSTPTRSLSTSGSSAVDVKERASQSLMLMAVNRNIETVQRLEQYAELAATAIQQLLDLKNKQATLLQEQLARKLTIQTGKQGNTIMWFTVATIIFLPLSFMASFLALEISEFPWSNDKLSLSFVLPILFTVSVAVCVPAVTMAFKWDKVKAAAGYVQNTAGVEYVSQIVGAMKEKYHRFLQKMKDARSKGPDKSPV
ncbi:hypothetical protein CEP52_017150 [Fusarium oligoseptatum]|uniref:Ankyrin repeat protein n=1 Tax=Fusarium oligoseptatum TaxID=2604345 RepID=A0A428RVX2_9HYPO|nr:hypothetical protein CEP52_017150 [Fusarium oligoseptatum]